MAIIEAVVTFKKHYVLVFIPFATYKQVGEVAILTVFGLPVYKRVGDARSLIGIVYRAGDGWIETEAGWRHRPFWKVAANSFLRAAQFWTSRPLLIATDCEEFSDLICPPMTLGYRLCRVDLKEAGHAS